MYNVTREAIEYANREKQGGMVSLTTRVTKSVAKKFTETAERVGLNANQILRACVVEFIAMHDVNVAPTKPDPVE